MKTPNCNRYHDQMRCGCDECTKYYNQGLVKQVLMCSVSDGTSFKDAKIAAIKLAVKHDCQVQFRFNFTMYQTTPNLEVIRYGETHA